MKLWMLSFFMLVFLGLNAQNGLSPSAGARGMAMGDADVTFEDINSLFSNQAGLAYLQKSEIILFASQHFLVEDIRNIAAGFVYPSDLGTFGLNLQYYGFTDYNEQKIGLNYGRKLTENLSIGIQFNYIGFRITEYGNKGLLSAELGIRSQVLKGLIIAAHIAGNYHDGYFGLITNDLNSIIGTFALYKVNDEVGEIRKMYILPEYRNMGIGKWMLYFLISKAQELGFRKVELLTAKPLIEAINLYEKSGFIEIKTSESNPRCDKAFYRMIG